MSKPTNTVTPGMLGYRYDTAAEEARKALVRKMLRENQRPGSKLTRTGRPYGASLRDRIAARVAALGYRMASPEYRRFANAISKFGLDQFDAIFKELQHQVDSTDRARTGDK